MQNRVITAIPLSEGRLYKYIVRIVLLFFCTAVFGLSPKVTFSQSSVIIDEDQAITVDEIFVLIKKQTKHTFIYEKGIFKNAPKIDLKKGEIGLNQLLDKIKFIKKDIDIVVTANNTIFIKKIQNNQNSQEQILGVITDTNGNPIPGATIQIKGTNKGAISDFEGNYVIYVSSPQNVLVFSSLGYKTKEVLVGNQFYIDVQLEEDVEALDEVVVNAGYYNVKQREKTGSISTIEASAIAKQPINNPILALQGQVTGLNITPSSGLNGGGFNINIRGLNSVNDAALQNANPLYIVNGVPFDGSSPSISDVNFQGIGNISPLNTINPSDIESIEILKDADATAIYGSRGANGVVLITTKSGVAGKTSIALNLSTTFSTVPRFIELANSEQYLEVRREAFANDGIDPLTNPEGIQDFDLDGTWDVDRNTNWPELLAGKTAVRRNAQLSISGGSEQTQFLLSGTVVNETTVFLGDFEYDRISVLSNLNHKSSDNRLSLNLSVNYNADKNNLPASNVYLGSFLLPPVAPALYNEDGSFNWEVNEDGFATWQHPLAQQNAFFESKTNNLIANALISYKILDNLNISTRLGYNVLNFEEVRTLPFSRIIFPDRFAAFRSRFSELFFNENDRVSWIVEPQLNWDIKLGKLKVSTLAGATFQQNIAEGTGERRIGFPTDDLILIRSAANSIEALPSPNSNYNFQSVFSRLNFNLNGKYLVNLTGRRDGSSRFGPNNRFGNFGAVGAAWIFSKERFFEEKLKFLSFAKIRGSYGLTGSDNAPDFAFLDSYGPINGSTYNSIRGLAPIRIFNPNLRWETNKKFEMALELGFLQDRIFLTTAWYRNLSGNQLTTIPQPGTTGFPTFRANLDAVVENTGLEIDLRTRIITKKDFKWTSTFNLTVPRNRLVKFDEIEDSPFERRLVVGESLSIQKLYEAQGVDPATGVFQFTDFDNDGRIFFRGDLEAIRDFAPKYFGGLNNTIGYKNWNLDFLFQFKKQLGRNFYDISFNSPGKRNQNFPVQLLDRWRQLGNIVPVQKYSVNNPELDLAYIQQVQSTANVTDASFIRLRTATLNYALPIESNFEASVFLQGQNLFTISPYFGPDPELSPIAVPQLRQISLGLNLTF